MAIHYETHRMERTAPLFYHRGNGISPTYYSPPNWHTNIELLAVTEGEALCRCGATSVRVQPGDIFVTGSDVIHTVISDTGVRYDCMIVDHTFCLENGFPVSHVVFTPLIRGDHALFEQFMAVGRAMHEPDSPYPAAALRAALLSFLLPLYTRYAVTDSLHATANPEAEARIARVIAYIHAHLTDALTLDTLAEIAGISRCYLSREFRRIADEPLFSYINTARCKNAYELISSGMTVTEAAVASGFDNLSYFTRSYKKRFGMLPIQARREQEGAGSP